MVQARCASAEMVSGELETGSAVAEAATAQLLERRQERRLEMPKFAPATSLTIAAVLRAMADQCDKEAERGHERHFAHEYAEAINPLLDELLNDDFFGTEGQADPRGDHRD